MMRNATTLLCLLWFVPLSAQPADIAELFEERARTLVYIEYYIEHEIDRQGVQGVGLVVADSGLVLTLQNVFPEWIPPQQFKDIRLYPAGNPAGDGFLASYLGQDAVSGWHFLQLQEADAAMLHLTPITRFEPGEPQIADFIWGVCMTSQELNYIPYFRDGRLSTTQMLPLPTGFSTVELAVPGGPVFLQDGRFAGHAGQSLARERDLWIGKDYFRANVRHPDESFIFLLAEPFLEELNRVLENQTYAIRQSWVGVVGTQPLDKDTARFLGLEQRGALVLSEILPDSPAEAGGLQDRDIVIAINAEPIPRLKPDSMIQRYFERAILLTAVGEPIDFTVMRSDGQETVTVLPGDVPKRLRETEKTYFDSIGLSLRELVINDSIQRRRDYREARGAMVSFIRNNSAAASGNLRTNDWILEIGGTVIDDYAQAVNVLQALLDDPVTEEIVLLVLRMNETSVIRIRKS